MGGQFHIVGAIEKSLANDFRGFARIKKIISFLLRGLVRGRFGTLRMKCFCFSCFDFHMSSTGNAENSIQQFALSIQASRAP
jgi:hypothetical protein